MKAWCLALAALTLSIPAHAAALDEASAAAWRAACAGTTADATLTRAQADALVRLQAARVLGVVCAEAEPADDDLLLAAEALHELSREAQAQSLLDALKPRLDSPAALHWRGSWWLAAGQLAQGRGEHPMAGGHYAAALQAMGEAGQLGTRRHAMVLIGQGVVWRNLGEIGRAARAADEAQAVLDAGGLEVSLEATDVINLRVVLAYARDDLPGTVELARQEIAMMAAIGRGEDPDVLHAYASLGGTLSQLGRLPEAEQALLQGMALIEKRPELAPYGQLGVMQNLASVYLSTGQAEQALTLAERALALAGKHYGAGGPRQVRPQMLKARAHWVAARYGAALQVYAEALALGERHRAKLPAATLFEIRDGMAEVQMALGDAEAARALLLASAADLESRSDISRYWRGRVLRQLARAESREGRWAEAVAYQSRAVEQVGAVNGAGGPYVVEMLAELCLVQLRAEQSPTVCARVQEALSGLDTAAASTRWRAHHALAAKAAANGDSAGAGRAYVAALAAADAAGTADPRWVALDALAVHLRAQQRPALAVYFGKQALAAIESLRADVRTQRAVAEGGFLSDKLGVYRRVADWLAEDGRIDEALDVLRLLKDEEFLDFVQRNGALAGTPASVTLSAAERQIDERWRRLSAADEAAWSLRAQDLLADLGVAAPLPPQAQAQPPRALVPRGQLRVHALVAEQQLTLVFDAATGRTVQRLRWSRAEVGREVGALLSAMGRGGASLPALQALYARLGAPIDAAARAAGARQLVLQLDGALRYLPLGALHDGRGYLAERYAIETRTTAQLPAASRAAPAPRVQALGVSSATAGRVALPGVAQEVCAIVDGPVHGLDAASCAADPRRRGVLAGEAWLNAEFTAQRLARSLQAAASADAGLLHLGTHFELRPGQMERSSLLLGDGARLSLGDLAALRFQGLSLVTLSACETGLGGGQGDDGREVDGLNGLILRRGAQAVLASLWRVDDASTSRLMTVFYRELRHVGPAQALRLAQQAVREAPGGVWSAPRHWAGFYVAR